MVSLHSKPLLILDETTLFYYNLRTKATVKDKVGLVKNWAAKLPLPNKPAPRSSASTSEKSKGSNHSGPPNSRTTTSSTAIVIAKETLRVPSKRKAPVDELSTDEDDNQYGGFVDEDEEVEREAAMSSPIKGKQRLTSTVCSFKYSFLFLTRY